MRFFLILPLLFTLQTQAAEGHLSPDEWVTTKPAAVATALALAGLSNIDSHQASALMIKIYRNDDTLEAFATQAGCPKLNTGSCVCTDNADYFDQYLAPILTHDLKIHPTELFQQRQALIDGYTFVMTFERSGTVAGGILKSALHNRMRFNVLINNDKHGEKKRQQFCSFNGKFKIYTETHHGNYIGVNLISMGNALRANKPLSLGHVNVAQGEVYYQE